MIDKIFESILVLNKESQKKFCKIIFLVILGSCIETVSLYLIYQTIKYFSDPVNYLLNENLFLNFFDYFNFENISLIYFILFCLISLFVIKFLFFSFLYYFQFKFVNSINANLSTKILKNYLFQNLEFHLKSDSSKLLRNIRDEVSQFSHGAILQSLNLITESLTFLSILILLLYFETKFVIFSISFILIAGIIYYVFIRSIYQKSGNIRQKFASISLKNAIESLHGIKDIKIFKSENFFLKNYYNGMKMLANANVIVSTLSQIPRLLLEVLIIIIVCFFILYNFNDELMNTNLLPSLGLFVAASFKLIPSISRILNSLNGLRFNLPATLVVGRELDIVKNIENNEMNDEENFNFEKEIKIENVSFKYPNREDSVFDDIKLIIKKNTLVGIRGESGSGKSTFIDLIIGLQDPNSGQILVDGKKLISNRDKWLNKIGYVPQKVYITNDTIKNNIALGLSKDQINYEKLKTVVDQCQLNQLIDKFPHGFDTNLGDRGVVISGGELQRIGIARALYKNSEILVLDEFTSALDDLNELKLIELIKKLSNSKTIILSSHKKKLFSFCDDIFVIKDKKIISNNE